MANVSVRNLSEITPDKTGDLAALNNVNFEIADGEFATILGPSGCGKTRTLRMIAGLEKCSAGDILVGDRRVNDVPARDRDIAMVFRDPALYPHMSVFENMGFGLKLRKFGDAEIKKRIRDAASILRIDELLERQPKLLSDDERRRVALGRAIVRQPKLFLIEEPGAEIEMQTRSELRKEIIMLHQRLEATMIYATYDSVEAMAMSDRIVVMDRGVVQQNDEPGAVYNTPRNLFVAGFVGSPAMNLVQGILKQDRDTLVFREADGGTIELRLEGMESPGAREFIGKPVVLGVRPEGIQVVERAEGNGRGRTGFPAVVEIVELAGAAAKMYLQTGAHTIVTANLASTLSRQSSGRRMRFHMDVSRVHLFDPASTLRIGTK
jgi:multiple sugar transport system ATP-binding protein